MLRITCLLGLAWALSAADAVPKADPFDLTRPFLRTYGTETGLPSSVVYGLSRDGHGRLWAATQEGAAVFDGLRWTPVTPGGSRGPVRAVLHASDGALWLGTESDGLWRLKGTAWTRFNPGTGINTLMESRTVLPGLYAGTRGQGLLRWTGEAWEPVELDSPWIWSLKELPGPDGVPALWATSQKGLWRNRGANWERLGTEFRQLDQCNGVQMGRGAGGRDQLWVSTWRQGLATWNGQDWAFLTPEQGFPTRLPTTLFGADPATPSALFVGTYDKGVAYRDGARWRILESSREGGIGAVYCGLPEAGNPSGVWLGTRDRGVGMLALDGWRILGKDQGLLGESVMALAEGSRGLWVGTNRGLSQIADGRVQEIQGPGAPTTVVNGILSEPDDGGRERLWVSTADGLLRWEGGRWHAERGPDGPFNQAYALLRSRSKGGSRLWVGTEGGLACLENGRWRLYTRKDGLPGSWVYALAESPGTLWLGTRDRGVVRYRDGVWTPLPLGPDHQAHWCNGLWISTGEDGRQWLWAAFVGHGVGRLEIGREQAGWKVWNPDNLPGFPSTSAFSIQQDRQDRLYVATRAGVTRITLQDGPGGPEPVRVEVFTEGDGLPSASISYFGNLVDRKGRVWMGTSNGLAAFDPALEVLTAPPAQPFLDAVEAEGRPMAVRNGHSFNHRQTRFRARFQWPLTRRREDARFRTQLLGLELAPGPWREEAEREFTGLAAGKYTLRLWARDHLGREAGPVDWPFEVRPAPWASWWAWTLYGLAFAGFTAVAVYWRTGYLEAQAHALEGIIDARTRDIAEALQEVMSAKTIAEFEREDAKLAREEAEAARHRAEEASRSKSSFLANMSHEIRTPMNAVMGLSQLGQKLDLAPKPREYFQKIGTASRSLLGIINDILDFSKIEAGRLELEAIPFQLSKVLRNVRELFEQAAEEKGLRLEFIVAPGTPDELVGDPLRLGQVLINLTSNALKFTSAGGIQVRVATAPVESLRCQFSVQDSGIGMTLAQVEKIFEPFAQADNSTTRKFGGTGLGLAISRRIVGLMGGELIASSELDRGSVFQFSVPFQKADSEQTAALLKADAPQLGEGVSSNLGKLRVLLVEDIPINQEVAREILAGWRIVPRIASSGAEALRILERESFDVVLMDVQMPEMDGYETTARIRRLPAHAALPILAMTANVMEQDRQACLEAGMNDFVAKPIETDHLLAALQRWSPKEWVAPMPAPDPTSELPLLDQAGALRRLGGNEGLLNSLFESFRLNHAGDGAALRIDLERAAWEDAGRLAHTLKGVAGNLGAMRLAAAASSVEKTLRGEAPEAAAAELSHLEETLAATLEILANRQAGGGP